MRWISLATPSSSPRGCCGSLSIALPRYSRVPAPSRVCGGGSIWCWLLWRFSRVKARLVPTHPDGCGGLVLLAMPGRAFAIILAAVGAAVAGTWGAEILRGADLRSFTASLGVLVAIALAVVKPRAAALVLRASSSAPRARSAWSAKPSTFARDDYNWPVRRAGGSPTPERTTLLDTSPTSSPWPTSATATGSCRTCASSSSTGAIC